MAFESPTDLRAFMGYVVETLKANGKTDAAMSLSDARDAASTTGSEWLGEIGAAIRRIQAECALSQSERAMLERIMETVNAVWPKL